MEDKSMLNLLRPRVQKNVEVVVSVVEVTVVTVEEAVTVEEVDTVVDTVAEEYVIFL